MADGKVESSPRERALLIGFCIAAALCEGFDIQAPGIAAPGLSRELHPAPGALGYFFSLGNVGLMLGAILGGRLADRLGRKTVMVGALCVFGVFSLATAAAGSLPALTVLRFLTGLGLGGAMPNVIAVAGQSSASGRNAGVAGAYMGMPLGGSIASLLVATAAAQHWRWVFVAGGVAPLLVAAAMAAFMPKPAQPARTTRAPASGYLTDLFGDGRAWATPLLWTGFFVAALTLHLMLNWLPLLLQGLGLSRQAAAYAQVGFSLGGAATSALLGRLLDSRRRGAAILGTVISVPLLVLALANAPPQPLAMSLLVLVLGGVVIGSQAILFTQADTLYPDAARGAGVGAAVGLGRAGAIAGPALAAVLVGAGRSPAEVLSGLMPILLTAGACIVTLDWLKLRPRLAPAE
ncbi:MAG: MFS transporter [Caulobacterales bacterium]|nr:MFS transporter [Caulobacterales bacterium]